MRTDHLVGLLKPDNSLMIWLDAEVSDENVFDFESAYRSAFAHSAADIDIVDESFFLNNSLMALQGIPTAIYHVDHQGNTT